MRTVEDTIRTLKGMDPGQYLRQCMLEGMTVRAIAADLGYQVSHVAVLSCLRRHGLAYRRGHWAPMERG